MSKTSKVNPEVRRAIVQFLTPGTRATNAGLRAYTANQSSLRLVQEATQKLVAEGTLVAEREKGHTWYSVKKVG